MNYLALTLVTLSTIAFVGCGKKKVEVVQHSLQVSEQTTERQSGPFSATNIVWEEVDGK